MIHFLKYIIELWISPSGSCWKQERKVSAVRLQTAIIPLRNPSCYFPGKGLSHTSVLFLSLHLFEGGHFWALRFYERWRWCLSVAGKPELRGYSLSPLSTDEIKAISSLLKRWREISKLLQSCWDKQDMLTCCQRASPGALSSDGTAMC